MANKPYTFTKKQFETYEKRRHRQHMAEMSDCQSRYYLRGKRDGAEAVRRQLLEVFGLTLTGIVGVHIDVKHEEEPV